MSKSNNWLSKLVLSALMVTTFVPQALAAEVGQAPTISSVTATPNPYDPKDSSENFGVVTMSWSLNTSANVKVEVYSPTNSSTPVAVPMDITNRDPGADSVNWDGKHNGAYVEEGTYTYKIYASNLYSPKDAASQPIPTVKTGTFVIDYADTNTVAPNISGVSVSPNPFDPDQTSTTFTFDLDKSADVKLEILGTTYSSTTTFAAGNDRTKTWNGRDNSNNQVPDGTYTYRLTATNPGTSSPSDVATGTITVDSDGGSNNDNAPNVTTHYATPTTFNPEDGEDTDIVVNLDKVADDLTVEVRIDGDYVKVDGTRHDVSNGTFTWDGEDEDGDIVADGIYTYRITATNSFGTNTATGTVRVDTDEDGGVDHDDDYGDLIDNIDTDRDDFNPEDDEKVKLEFDVVKNSVKVTVDVLDEDDDVIRTLFSNKSYDDSNNNTVSWDGEDKDGDIVNDGDYTIRIRATKSGYPNEVAYRDVEVDTDGSSNGDDDFEDDYGDLIDNVDVEDALFNPEDKERAKLIFDVEQDNVDITVDVIDRDEDVEKELIDKQYDDSNNNSVYWNGRDEDNDYSKDDLYLFRIRAEKSGHDDEVAYRWLEVDTDGIIIGFPNGNGKYCAGFTDVPASNPYCKAIELMKLKGIFSGYPDGTFRIGSAINRAETVKVVVLAIGLSLANNNTVHFWDVPNNAWYISYLASAVRYGVINGYPDGAFRGDRVVNRVELLKIFLEGTGITMPYCTKAPFNDTPANAETRWYIDYVCFAANNGLMYGDGAGNYNPAAPMTRGDVAMLFYNFYVRGMDSQINLGYYTGSNTYNPYTYVPTTSYYYY
jgi:flagellar hook assembly protein FlgD